MTSVRAKRNSKAPNRFSSDNSQIETTNATGETIIDYNDNTTSTTHSLAPMNRAIKLKPAIREPLKVKLPKLKRSQQPQSTKDNTGKSSISETKIHKIKLPPLEARKSKDTGNLSDSKSKVKKSTSSKAQDQVICSDGSQQKHNAKAESALYSGDDSQKLVASSPAMEVEQVAIDTSATSKSTEGEKSSLDNSSFESEDSAAPSRMEIVVSQPDAPSASGIRCPCGVNDDLGVMVECEKCSTWQHGHCINLATEEEAYEGYICGFCALPQNRARDSLSRFTVGDKFQIKLENFVKRHTNNSLEDKDKYNVSAENDAQLSIEDLSQAIKELYRVFNSLKVKYRLLTSQAYELELRIWQNPYWSGKQQENLDKEKNIYFMDRCRSNLKLNIRNMVIKLEERCQLIEQVIATNSFNNLGIEQEQTMNQMKQKLGIVLQGVKEFKNKLNYAQN